MALPVHYSTVGLTAVRYVCYISVLQCEMLITAFWCRCASPDTRWASQQTFV